MSKLRFHEWTTYNKVGDRLEPSRHVLGSRYDPDLDIAEIAKQIRKLIKDAIKAGYLPRIKTSVRIKRYSGGESLNVNVDECLEAIEIEAVVDCVNTLERFVKSYQRTLSQSQGDYWENNFIGFVNWYADRRYNEWRRAQWEKGEEVSTCQ
jgi:hypothetical protein